MVAQLIRWIARTEKHRMCGILFAAGLFVVSVVPLLAARTQINEPESVQLIGTLHREVVPGPPNYENILAGDRPETVWFVTLRERDMVQSNGRGSGIGGQADLERIQLLLPEKRYNHLLNKKVVASGTLFDAHTVHHHTPVLMFVTMVKTY